MAKYCIRHKHQFTAEQHDGYWDIFHDGKMIEQISDSEFNRAYEMGWSSMADMEKFRGPLYIKGLLDGMNMVISDAKWRLKRYEFTIDKLRSNGMDKEADKLEMKARECRHFISSTEIWQETTREVTKNENE